MTREEFVDLLGCDVSHETFSQLGAFVGLIEKWGKAINLVSTSDRATLWHRHILDSAQLVRYTPLGARTWADIGSGGGFPGIVVALLCMERSPEMSFYFVESDHRKAAFLAEAVRVLKVPAVVRSDRAEAIPPLAADIVSARALAALPDLLPLVVRHLKDGGIALLLKGQNYKAEIENAAKNWSFQYTSYQSITNPTAAVIRLSEVKRA